MTHQTLLLEKCWQLFRATLTPFLKYWHAVQAKFGLFWQIRALKTTTASYTPNWLVGTRQHGVAAKNRATSANANCFYEMHMVMTITIRGFQLSFSTLLPCYCICIVGWYFADPTYASSIFACSPLPHLYFLTECVVVLLFLSNIV